MSGSSSFRPQMTRMEAADLSSRYEIKDDVPALKAGEAIRGGAFARRHLNTIFAWKTGNRGKSRLELNTDEEVEDTLHLAVLARKPRAAIAVLRGLHGVDTPVASAIMTVISPEIYTIIDFRALAALGSETIDRSLAFYLRYLSYCTELAGDWQMPLRQLDRALWQWSKKRDRSKSVTALPI